MSVSRSRFLVTTLLATAFGAISLTGSAQQSSIAVDAVMMSERIPVGEQTSMVVRVANGKPEALPDSVPVTGLEITRSPRVEQKYSLGTGGNQSEYQFYYTVTSTRAGQYVIPSITVRVEGKDYVTKPLSLNVYERDPSDPALDASRPYFANLTTPEREVYAGQMTPFDLDVYVRGARSINDMGPPMMRHESIVIDFDRNYQLDMVELDGIQFTTAQRPGFFFGLTPGTYTIGPAEVKVAMIDESSPFGRMPGFFHSFVAKTLRSNPLEIVVKPLPATGRLSGFAGAVGDFEVKVTASPTELTVGDPISLEFTVTGPGNYETLQAPNMALGNASKWRSYEARKIVDPAETSNGVKSGRATFSQIVMPQEQIAEIPPFELVFFNPETETYQSRQTDPIPVRISPDTRVATSAPAGMNIPGSDQNAGGGGGGSFAVPVEAAATPKASFNDVVQLPSMDPNWRKAPVIVTARPIFWIGQIIPALALFSLLGFGVARRFREKKAKTPTDKSVPFKTARAAVTNSPNRSGFYRNILAALNSWDREISSSARKELPESLAAAHDALRSRAQWLVYGAGGDEQARPLEPSEKAECLKILDALGDQLN